MAAKPENIDELLRTPAFGSYGKILATHLTNEATRPEFDMKNLGMIYVKTPNSVFSKYNKKARK